MKVHYPQWWTIERKDKNGFTERVGFQGGKIPDGWHKVKSHPASIEEEN